MADRTRPHLASVTIRRLVLPAGEIGADLDSAIGAALAREFGALPGAAPESGLAQEIARGIARHPDLSSRVEPFVDRARGI